PNHTHQGHRVLGSPKTHRLRSAHDCPEARITKAPTTDLAPAAIDRATRCRGWREMALRSPGLKVTIGRPIGSPNTCASPDNSSPAGSVRCRQEQGAPLPTSTQSLVWHVS